MSEKRDLSHSDLIVGYMTPDKMSDMKLAAITRSAITQNIACMSGIPFELMDAKIQKPRPSQLKMVSVMIAPPSNPPKATDAFVTIGRDAFFRACLKSTVLSGRPLALAVVM